MTESPPVRSSDPETYLLARTCGRRHRALSLQFATKRRPGAAPRKRLARKTDPLASVTGKGTGHPPANLEILMHMQGSAPGRSRTRRVRLLLGPGGSLPALGVRPPDA